MSEAVEKSVADIPFLDDTDDFIQSHLDLHSKALSRQAGKNY
ncbi:MAG: hypothetical protein ACOC55_00065 [Candidatus Natronoplasma sp.]